MLRDEQIASAVIVALVGVSLSLSLDAMSMLRVLAAIVLVTVLLVAVDVAADGSLTRRMITFIRAIGY